MKRRSKFIWIGVGTIVVVGLLAAIAGPVLSRVEQPEYKVLSSSGAVEVRQYDEMIAAQATVSEKRDEAINAGFRLIAGYIFGANKPNAEIAMTAPVQQQRNQKIAMTSPVTQQSDGGVWTVKFIMPKRWTMKTLPAPEDSRVKLMPIAAERVIAIRFSGTAKDALISQKTDELREAAKAQNLTIVGEPVYAFYNPPWTLPFLRRNEIMFSLETQ